MTGMIARNFVTTALLSVLAVGFVLMGGCTEKSEGSGVAVSQEQKAGAGSECVAGTSKTVVGRSYLRTGIETHTIEGKSFNLCCWEVENPTRKTKNKICGDDASTPVGYSNGILWETDGDTGGVYKSMERYQKDGKSCQQFFDLKGNLEAEHCE